jgi:tripartite-type tricarboxylate transporter receptor subunit TctC
MIRSVISGTLTALGLVLMAAPAPAQTFPSRPITLMVGLAAGGITDVTARLYAEAVSRHIGQRIIVENRTGAGGAVAAAAVQNAPADGHTLLVFSGSQHATIPAAGQANYDPVKGFAAVTFLFNSVVVLTVPADSPAKTLSELHDLGRKKPGGLTFGTPGLGSPSHLLGAKILLADKVPAETTHYRGGAPMMADLITGRLDFGWPTLSTSRAYLADKKLRGLALDAEKRWPMLPDVPTLSELRQGDGRLLVRACRAGWDAARHRQRAERDVRQGVAGSRAQAAARRERHTDRHQHARANGEGHGGRMVGHAATGEGTQSSPAMTRVARAACSPQSANAG